MNPYRMMNTQELDNTCSALHVNNLSGDRRDLKRVVEEAKENGHNYLIFFVAHSQQPARRALIRAGAKRLASYRGCETVGVYGLNINKPLPKNFL